ncbi:hypothetical protein O9Z70_14560 [Devosia sp. YIM 151766]|uniref:hypothetical protein n=1 Tax=Devosia sp. YIM 151766 TaxID=3017325 RepID=UPI00255C31CA|nr:hypothetical protein [Devosia sp. YIM 151766]WIY52659.1 hypothetical protein O9Z70_14560 [Devosia sp. YIM 151766]
MPHLEQSETDRTLPVPAAPATPRPSLAHSAPNAAFVSQLIAARERLSPQRTSRLENAAGAVGAYGKGGRIAERRMPLGYRRTLLI